MFELKIKNLTNGSVFSKYFNSPYLLKQFKNKLKHSKKLQIVSSDC
jgi:hypothetical protein